jgi:hypothetical protein
LETKEDVAAESGPQVPVVRAATIQLLRGWRAQTVSAQTALGAVTVAEWLQFLSRLAAALEQPVTATMEIARIPWWR